MLLMLTHRMAADCNPQRHLVVSPPAAIQASLPQTGAPQMFWATTPFSLLKYLEGTKLGPTNPIGSCMHGKKMGDCDMLEKIQLPICCIPACTMGCAAISGSFMTGAEEPVFSGGWNNRLEKVLDEGCRLLNSIKAKNKQDAAYSVRTAHFKSANLLQKLNFCCFSTRQIHIY